MSLFTLLFLAFGGFFALFAVRNLIKLGLAYASFAATARRGEARPTTGAFNDGPSDADESLFGPYYLDPFDNVMSTLIPDDHTASID